MIIFCFKNTFGIDILRLITSLDENQVIQVGYQILKIQNQVVINLTSNFLRNQ
jgi:hypothetical protein